MADRKASSSSAPAPIRSETPRRSAEGVPGRWDRPAMMAASGGRVDQIEGKKLLVGRDISLAGQIATCDFLLVEGQINGKLIDGKLLEIQDTGSFFGEAIVDVAHISGIFDGQLTVRDRLVIQPTGRVTGTIRYLQIEIVVGGTIAGDIQVLPTVEHHEDFSDAPLEPVSGDMLSVST